MKLQCVNTLVFLSSDTVLTPCRFKFCGQPIVLGVKNLASINRFKVREVLGVMAYNYEGLWRCWGY